MARVRLRYLARLREALGCGEEYYELPAAEVDLPALLDAIDARHGAAAVAALSDDSVRIACNQELVDPTTLRIRSDDEIAFLPPVTGG